MQIKISFFWLLLLIQLLIKTVWLPLHPLRVDIDGIAGRGRGSHLSIRFAGALDLSRFALRLLLEAVTVNTRQRLVVVVAVLVGRRGRIGRRKRRRHSHRHVVWEHGHELVVVQPVEPVGTGIPTFFHQWGFKKRDGIARRTAVVPAPRRRKVEKLVDPARRLLVVVAVMRWWCGWYGRRGRRGDEICNGRQFLVRKRRPILGHGWYFGR